MRGSAPSTVRAGLDALVAAGGSLETLLFLGPAETRQNQQQAQREKLHMHPAVRIKLWDDELDSTIK